MIGLLKPFSNLEFNNQGLILVIKTLVMPRTSIHVLYLEVPRTSIHVFACHVSGINLHVSKFYCKAHSGYVFVNQHNAVGYFCLI